ncbi:hypothetical protein DMUE_1402 [Dictyocoela muelleri]|nr:hypothetical protein DMUE_1402 [Dictyocoela muelleri]
MILYQSKVSMNAKKNILRVLCLTKIAWERVRPGSIKKSFIKLFEFNEIKNNNNKKYETVFENAISGEINDVLTELATGQDENENEMIETPRISEINSIFYNLENYVKEYCPENLLDLHIFKSLIIKNVRKNMNFWGKITDFTIKNILSILFFTKFI